MASSSAARSGGAATRIRNAASTICSDNQSLIGDIRKGFSLIKDLAIDFERENQSAKVKELEDASMDLLNAYEKCRNLSVAIQFVGDHYQPREGLTDFKKMLEDEISKVEANSSSDLHKNPLRRQFMEAVWNVHHSGQPMPGDEQEDIVMTSTQCNVRNINCPVSGKPITELQDPVRSVDCNHIYDKAAIMHYIKSKTLRKAPAKCPVAGCPKILHPGNVMCDPLLRIEIDEVRAMSKQTAATEVIEDFTELEEE
ncbi:hypothetical protein L484_012159 [Morus notabilis]|uniref:SP-RING-type domain-containing protein n=1 Tax=Morus notabilis TaxID=981085 RepID=W9RFI7_9ROSA|nr:E3 SUMO-protein ligase MMS21 [Morus notabilis]EXB75035.1 hypothetical protein L484_012159 [Morus notabilis]